ncbi:AAA family ATPase [Paenibacillus jiagnxiensis]|uniref:AAA family ATPase n=1 Tax=Paenibacillus jiagnxiensis TaxID=3228926 RepID=UPI0033A15259
MYLKSVELLRDKVPSMVDYPFHLPAIRSLNKLHFTHKVTFFVGENGSGKSTLLEALAYQSGFHTAGGGRHNNYQVHASESALAPHIRLSWMPKITNGFFLRAESFYHFASHIDEVDSGGFRRYGGRSLHQQSHGESFLNLFLHRFIEKGIYLLDEPEAALSPTRQLSLLRIIRDLSGHSQFIIATHSPILLGYPGAQILSFDGSSIREIAYEETEHYYVTRQFLTNREPMLDELFRDDGD